MNTRIMLSTLSTLILMLSIAVQPTFATDYTVSSTSACTLADAIRAANKNEAVSSCSSGGEIDVIVVTSDITLQLRIADHSLRVDHHFRRHHYQTCHQWRLCLSYLQCRSRKFTRLTLRGLQLTGGRNWGQRGGALRILAGHVTLIDVRMEDNWAEKGGGALRAGNRGTVTCNMCVFVDNESSDGGAIWIGDYGNLTLTDSAVYNNSAQRGGGMYIQYGHATLAGTSFSNNHAAEGPDLLSIDAEIDVRP